jgi:methylmalonyl-CoA/ethylmalonyl-CoA epimerase
VAALIRRLDHIIVAVRDRGDWIPPIRRVLALEPGRMLEGAGVGFASFSNAEFAIGDGFLGVVEPAGDGAQLSRFLARFGEGFYAMSIDVGDVTRAVARLQASGASVRIASPELAWLGPRGTHGVVYQVIGGMLLGAGANPRYLGVSSLTVAVTDLAVAVDDYQTLFGFDQAENIEDDRFGYRGAALRITGSELDDVILLAEPKQPDSELGRHVAQRGEGIFSFGIAVADLAGDVDRLQRVGVAVDRDDGPLGPRALIDPSALGSLRVELVARTIDP